MSFFPRPTPGPSGRAVSLCVWAAAGAVVLDAWSRPFGALAPGVMWLDLAALAALAFGVPWREVVRGEDAGTPLDGLVLATVSLGTVMAAGLHGRDGSADWLAQALACGGLYFGLVRGLRRHPAAIESAWRALAAVAIVLGAHALVFAAPGLATLQRASLGVDAHWAGRHVLPKLLVFLAVALSGRAWQRRAGIGWRLAVFAALAGAVPHAGLGLGLSPRSLGKLDDPVFFSTLCVTLLVVAAAARHTWTLVHVRPLEARRWQFLSIALGVLGGFGALSETTGGEGVRALGVLAVAAAMAARAHPLAAEESVAPAPEAAREETLAKAA